jgi:hypothetical protein
MPMSNKSKPDYEALKQLFRPHIDSFDYFIDDGLEKAVTSVRAIEISQNETKLRNILSLHFALSYHFSISSLSKIPLGIVLLYLKICILLLLSF